MGKIILIGESRFMRLLGEAIDESSRYSSCGFEMLVGIPGSGKSTYLRGVNNGNVVVVCPDDIRRELTGDVSNQSMNREVWELAERLIMEYLSRGRYVILDATNVNTAMRNRLVGKVREFNPGIPTYATMFDADPEVSKERISRDIANGVDRAKVPPEVIDRMYGMYQDTAKVIGDEGFTGIYRR